MTITEAFDVKEDVIGQKIGNVIVKITIEAVHEKRRKHDRIRHGITG